MIIIIIVEKEGERAGHESLFGKEKCQRPFDRSRQWQTR